MTVGSTRLSVAPSVLRKPGQAQQGPDCCIGGHLLVPYEQYTQQSPGFGLSTVLHCSHSYSHIQASVGIVSSFLCPHAGHVMLESSTTAAITAPA